MMLCPQKIILECFLFLKGILSCNFYVSLHHVTKNTLRFMEYQALNESAQMKANAKKRSIYINKVDSGMPRWLIELGFVLFVAQAVSHIPDWRPHPLLRHDGGHETATPSVYDAMVDSHRSRHGW